MTRKPTRAARVLCAFALSLTPLLGHTSESAMSRAPSYTVTQSDGAVKQEQAAQHKEVKVPDYNQSTGSIEELLEAAPQARVSRYGGGEPGSEDEQEQPLPAAEPQISDSLETPDQPQASEESESASVVSLEDIADSLLETRVSRYNDDTDDQSVAVSVAAVARTSNYEVVSPEIQEIVSPPSFRILRSRYDKLIERVAAKLELDPSLIKSVMHAESAFDRYAVSHKGAAGLMQLMPATARRYGADSLFNPNQNVLAGSRYLNDLLKQFNGNISLAVAGYNAGENAVLRFGGIPPYKETQNYVKRVLQLYKQYRKHRCESQRKIGIIAMGCSNTVADGGDEESLLSIDRKVSGIQ